MTTPREQLAGLIGRHFPINDRFTSKSLMIKCQCGELAPTWHGHLADAIIQAGWRPPKVKKPKPPHDPRVISVEETEQMLNREWGWY